MSIVDGVGSNARTNWAGSTSVVIGGTSTTLRPTRKTRPNAKRDKGPTSVATGNACAEAISGCIGAGNCGGHCYGSDPRAVERAQWVTVRQTTVRLQNSQTHGAVCSSYESTRLV